jgi:hypothetical protein
MERNDGQMRQVRHPNTSSRVLQYLRANPDVVIPYEELARELGLAARPQIVNAVGHLVNRGIAPIDRPMKGTVIYHSGNVNYDLSENDAFKVTPREARQLEAALDMELPDAYHNDGKASAEHKRITRELLQTGTADYPAAPPVYPYYEFVGNMREMHVIRDQAQELYVAVPLSKMIDVD